MTNDEIRMTNQCPNDESIRMTKRTTTAGLACFVIRSFEHSSFDSSFEFRHSSLHRTMSTPTATTQLYFWHQLGQLRGPRVQSCPVVARRCRLPGESGPGTSDGYFRSRSNFGADKIAKIITESGYSAHAELPGDGESRRIQQQKADANAWLRRAVAALVLWLPVESAHWILQLFFPQRHLLHRDLLWISILTSTVCIAWVGAGFYSVEGPEAPHHQHGHADRHGCQRGVFVQPDLFHWRGDKPVAGAHWRAVFHGIIGHAGVDQPGPLAGSQRPAFRRQRHPGIAPHRAGMALRIKPNEISNIKSQILRIRNRRCPRLLPRKK